MPWPSSIYSWPLREWHLVTKPPPYWGSSSPKICGGEKNMTLHLGPGHILWVFSSKCWLAAFPTHFLNSTLLRKLEFKEAEKNHLKKIYRWINSRKQLDCSRQLRFTPHTWGLIKNSKDCLHLAWGSLCMPSSWPGPSWWRFPEIRTFPSWCISHQDFNVEHFIGKPCFP